MRGGAGGRRGGIIKIDATEVAAAGPAGLAAAGREIAANSEAFDRRTHPPPAAPSSRASIDRLSTLMPPRDTAR